MRTDLQGQQSKRSDTANCARLVLLVALAGLSAQLLSQQPSVSNECAKASAMRVYSNVFLHQETGDVLGYELAIRRENDSSVNALLYVYEGGNSGPGIPLSGQILNNRLTLQGTWVENLIEYPSRKPIVQKRFVKLAGSVSAQTFRGELTIEGMDQQERIRLKHGNRIWSCRNWNPSPASKNP
jgi:hypothetical protein